MILTQSSFVSPRGEGPVYLCYIDESGTSAIPGNSTHFILAGLSIPIWKWKDCDTQVQAVKNKYDLVTAEIHAGWILRRYKEQEKITNFESLDYKQRRYQVESLRKTEILRLQRAKNPALYKQVRKDFDRTKDYIHLTYAERQNFVRQLAQCVCSWGFARLFAECVDKIYFDPARYGCSIDEQSFEQLVSRFEQYLRITGISAGTQSYGLLIHDNNVTVAQKHTQLMKKFFQAGTLWTDVKNIIETPLFVDSQLTSMVQIADLCAYALRVYLEKQEEELLGLVFQRADRKDDIVVGVRHFSDRNCSCRICVAHRKPVGP